MVSASGCCGDWLADLSSADGTVLQLARTVDTEGEMSAWYQQAVNAAADDKRADEGRLGDGDEVCG